MSLPAAGPSQRAAGERGPVAAALAGYAPVPAGRAPRRRIRVPWPVRLAAAFMVGLAVIAATAPHVAPHNPERGTLRARLTPPALRGADGQTYLLGTDHLGRDVLSRVIFGARVSLTVGFAVALIASAIGLAIGLFSGFVLSLIHI